MGGNNSTLLEIVVDHAPVKPGGTVCVEVVLSTVKPLTDVSLRIIVNATNVNEADFSLTAAKQFTISMRPGQERFKIKIPVVFNGSSDEGPKTGTMRILVDASLVGVTMAAIDKQVPVQLRKCS